MSTDTVDKLSGLFPAIDRLDGEAFASYMTEDVEFIFGNAEPVKGRENVQRAVEGFFDSISGLTHQIDQRLFNDQGSAVFGTVTYRRKNGTELEVPFANLFLMAGDKIRSYRIVLDNHTLYS